MLVDDVALPEKEIGVVPPSPSPKMPDPGCCIYISPPAYEVLRIKSG